jgi:hypothetical protein
LAALTLSKDKRVRSTQRPRLVSRIAAFDTDENLLAGCMQANGLAADACFMVKDSSSFWEASGNPWWEVLVCCFPIRGLTFLDI